MACLNPAKYFQCVRLQYLKKKKSWEDYNSMCTDRKFIFLKTSEEQYGLNSRYVCTKMSLKNSLMWRGGLLGLVDTSFLLRA